MAYLKPVVFIRAQTCAEPTVTATAPNSTGLLTGGVDTTVTFAKPLPRVP